MSLVKSVAGAPGYALAIAQQTTGHPSLQSIMVYLLTLLGTQGHAPRIARHAIEIYLLFCATKVSRARRLEW